MKDNQGLHRRNQGIIDEISKMLVEKSPRGNRKYTMGYIYDIIGERHELRSRTVENIFGLPVIGTFPDEKHAGREPAAHNTI